MEKVHPVPLSALPTVCVLFFPIKSFHVFRSLTAVPTSRAAKRRILQSPYRQAEVVRPNRSMLSSERAQVQSNEFGDARVIRVYPAGKKHFIQSQACTGKARWPRVRTKSFRGAV